MLKLVASAGTSPCFVGPGVDAREQIALAIAQGFDDPNFTIAEVKRAASIDLHGTVTVGDTDRSLRFYYADEVAVQLLPDVTENPGLIRRLADARLATGRFAGLAFAAYRAAHADAFTLSSDQA